jgi:hypothetical protein
MDLKIDIPAPPSPPGAELEELSSHVPATSYLYSARPHSFRTTLVNQFGTLWKLWEESERGERMHTPPSQNLATWLLTPHDTWRGACHCRHHLPPLLFSDEWDRLEAHLSPSEATLSRLCILCYRIQWKLYEQVIQAKLASPLVLSFAAYIDV